VLAVAVPHAGLTDRDRPDARDQLSLGQVAVAHDAGPTVGRLPAAVRPEVIFDFLLDGGLEHFAHACGDELF
jgi:hypothetical protein